MGAGGLGEVAEDGHGALRGGAPAQGAGLHGRQVLCLVDHDVPVPLWGLPGDEIPQFFEADPVVERPGIGVGRVGPRTAQSGLL